AISFPFCVRYLCSLERFLIHGTVKRFLREMNEMDKRPQHVTRKTHKRGAMSARRHTPRSLPLKAAARREKIRQGMMACNQLEAILAYLPESVIVCDREEKILRINAAALQLFEVPSEDRCRGT